MKNCANYSILRVTDVDVDGEASGWWLTSRKHCVVLSEYDARAEQARLYYLMNQWINWPRFRLFYHIALFLVQENLGTLWLASLTFAGFEVAPGFTDGMNFEFHMVVENPQCDQECTTIERLTPFLNLIKMGHLMFSSRLSKLFYHVVYHVQRLRCDEKSHFWIMSGRRCFCGVTFR